MKKLERRHLRRNALLPGMAGLLAVTLAGCMSPAQETAANAQQDREVCASMGASFGTPAHTQCMLRQQQRRDQEHLIFMEQARIAQEMARDAQEMRQNPSS